MFWKLAHYAANLPPDRWLARILTWTCRGHQNPGRPRNAWDTMIQKFRRYQQLGANRWSNLMPHFVTFCAQTWRRRSKGHYRVESVAMSFISPVPSTGCLQAYRFHFISLCYTWILRRLVHGIFRHPSQHVACVVNFGTAKSKQGHKSCHCHGTSLAMPHLPLTQGGLGLMSATILAAPAYWSSWADTLPVLQTQLPELTHQILEQFNTHSEATPALQAAEDAARSLAATGWEPPTWAAIASGQTQAPAPPPAIAEGPLARGWQHQASATAHARLRDELFHTLPPASQALVMSQSGPFASRAFTTIPYTNDFTYPSHLFRILLLRRLRLPLPLFARTCRCRRTFDSLGDHRAACAQSGVLRSRGGPLERAAARVCREAGARVATHARLADLNIPHVQHLDDRRIEVIANGLALWGGAQLAVDTTLVSHSPE